jgi:hypothetical protein
MFAALWVLQVSEGKGGLALDAVSWDCQGFEDYKKRTTE